MAKIGDQRGPLFNRHYVAANPDKTQGPLTWNLSDRDISQGDIGGGGADKVPISSGTGLLSENCIQGQLLYIIQTGLNEGQLALAKADDINTSLVVGAALASKTAGENVDYARNSTVNINTAVTDEPLNLNSGSTYYLSPENAGNYTETVPTTTGQVIVDVGTALSANQIAIEIQPPIQL